jgi:hypothetical protein
MGRWLMWCVLTSNVCCMKGLKLMVVFLLEVRASEVRIECNRRVGCALAWLLNLM